MDKLTFTSAKVKFMPDNRILVNWAAEGLGTGSMFIAINLEVTEIDLYNETSPEYMDYGFVKALLAYLVEHAELL